ncbi:MAG: PqqD family protein [Lachnospiraceae bacterium]|nr:PqqD family protein [Lachnospiraceae bacterium]
MKKIYRREGIVNRKIHDLFYLIDIKMNYSQDRCYLYQINEIGNYIWESLDLVDDIESMTDLLIKEINDDIDWKLVYDDVKDFVNFLCCEGYLVKMEG